MSQITRHHTGAAAITTDLLTALEHLLDMDLAKPPEMVHPLAEQLRDPGRDISLDLDRNGAEIAHDWLGVLAVDAMQQLRRQHDAGGQVDVARLCEVRNALDTLALTWGVECEEWVTTDLWDREDLHAAVVAHFADGTACWRCPTCQFVMMRDRLDALLDRNGHHGGPYYTPADYDADAKWREYDTPTSPLIPKFEALAAA